MNGPKPKLDSSRDTLVPERPNHSSPDTAGLFGRQTIVTISCLLPPARTRYQIHDLCISLLMNVASTGHKSDPIIIESDDEIVSATANLPSERIRRSLNVQSSM